MFVGTGKNRLGSRYKKVVYREYTDATFRTRKPRQPQEKHLEILGDYLQFHSTFIFKYSFPT